MCKISEAMTSVDEWIKKTEQYLECAIKKLRLFDSEPDNAELELRTALKIIKKQRHGLERLLSVAEITTKAFDKSRGREWNKWLVVKEAEEALNLEIEDL